MFWKKLIIPFAVALCLCATSCEKTGANRFTGSYTYKTSGVLGLVPVKTTIKSSCSTEVDTTFMTLVTEQGQLNIVKDNASGDVILTWNDLTGDACHTTAEVDGKIMMLNPGQKNVSVKSGLISYEGIVTFSGEGEVYDDMLIIPLSYSGEFSVKGEKMKVASSSVECVAKLNQ